MTTATYETLYTLGQERANTLYAKLPTAEVMNAARTLSEDLTAPEETLNWTLTYLESVMPEDEFVAFCETL
jgi:hypothetical protein